MKIDFKFTKPLLWLGLVVNSLSMLLNTYVGVVLHVTLHLIFATFSLALFLLSGFGLYLLNWDKKQREINKKE